jgi:hypothetical protein
MDTQTHKKPEARQHEPRCTVLRFIRKDKAVMLGQRCICVADSATMAKRIAIALNIYTPGEKGY